MRSFAVDFIQKGKDYSQFYSAACPFWSQNTFETQHFQENSINLVNPENRCGILWGAYKLNKLWFVSWVILEFGNPISLEGGLLFVLWVSCIQQIRTSLERGKINNKFPINIILKLWLVTYQSFLQSQNYNREVTVEWLSQTNHWIKSELWAICDQWLFCDCHKLITIQNYDWILRDSWLVECLSQTDH